MEIVGIVENGQIRLPPSVKLPDGLTVRVIIEENAAEEAPLEEEALGEVDVEADLRWASGHRFARLSAGCAAEIERWRQEGRAQRAPLQAFRAPS